jgi:hypothetical protein
MGVVAIVERETKISLTYPQSALRSEIERLVSRDEFNQRGELSDSLPRSLYGPPDRAPDRIKLTAGASVL